MSNRVGSFYAHHAGKLNSRLSAECSSRADAFLVCLSPRDTVLITLPMEDWPFFAAGGLPRDLPEMTSRGFSYHHEPLPNFEAPFFVTLVRRKWAEHHSGADLAVGQNQWDPILG